MWSIASELAYLEHLVPRASIGRLNAPPAEPGARSVCQSTLRFICEPYAWNRVDRTLSHQYILAYATRLVGSVVEEPTFDDWTVTDFQLPSVEWNENVADAVCARLEQAGVRCWIAPRDIRPGGEWGESIISAIESARIMVLIFSRESNRSKQVLREVTAAVNHNVIVIPFRVHDVTPTRSMEYLLNVPHWLDAMTPPLAAHIEELTRTTLGILGTDHAAPRNTAADSDVQVHEQPPHSPLPPSDVTVEHQHSTPSLPSVAPLKKGALALAAVLLSVALAAYVFSGRTQRTQSPDTKGSSANVVPKPARFTQRQWERVMGTWPSSFTNATYRDSRPVDRVSYSAIRGASAGAGWPANGNVDATSFVGLLRTRTGLGFDLPTESQWEYAGRAGTTTTFNSGYNLIYKQWNIDAHLAAVGRYWDNGGSGFTENGDATVGTAKVGSYLPNQWGLYDIHGNVIEWCLDWYGPYPGTVSDPKGATTGSKRVCRGSSWHGNASSCRVALRNCFGPTYASYCMGFRVAASPGQPPLPLSVEPKAKTQLRVETGEDKTE